MQLHHLDAQALHLRLLRAVAAQMVDIQPVFSEIQTLCFIIVGINIFASSFDRDRKSVV